MPSVINATTTNGVAISPDNSGSLQLATNNGTTAVTIDTSQNVGIGTTSPSNKLSVVTASGSDGFISVSSPTTETAGVSVNGGTSSNKGAIVRFQKDASTKWTMGTDSAIIGGTSDNFHLYSGGANAVLFSTNATERMRITSGGDVLVNATAVLANSAGKLQVECSAPSGGSQYGALIGGNGTGYTVYGIRFLNTYTPAIVGSITINSSSTSYNTSSDYRLKENIAPMTGALEKVQQLNPVTYKWKLDGKDGQGFIAHELQAVVPDAVTGEKDAVDEEGNPIYQGVDTSFLVATLTAAIQEQQAMIETLKTELDTVKAELNTLKNPPVEGTE